MLEAANPLLGGKLITVYNGHTADLAGAPPFGGLSQKEDIIVTAGRLGTFQKATEVLLDAFRLIAGSSGYQLHLAGAVEPAFRPRIEQFLKENPGLADRVIFHGSLDRKELFELYNRSRIFCLPSRFEGMAVVLPEAMHYGNVIVTTADGSIRPLIETGQFGLVVERDDSRTLADALLKLMTDREMAIRMAEEARKISSELLSWDRITDVLTGAIRERKGR
jgi:glycosyltransferase involved in cell wall biosynthesis